MSSQYGITPGRTTVLEFEATTQYLLSRPTWYFKRKAHEVARAERNGVKAFTDTRLEVGVDCWRLASVMDEIGSAKRSAYSSSAIGIGDFNTAAGVTSYDTYRSPTDLTGVSVDGGVLAAGVPALRRNIAAGGDWSAGTLQRSNPGAPSDPDSTDSVQMIRMLSGKVTYPSNAGFMATFSIAPYFGGGGFGHTAPPGSLFQLYFGGGTDRVPAGNQGGGYCLDIRSDNRAILWERVGTGGTLDSVIRMQIPLTQQPAMPLDGILWGVLPLGSRHIVVQNLSLTEAMQAGSRLGIFRKQGFPGVVYRHTPDLTGVNTVRYITGAGTVALDTRADYRGAVTIYHNRFKTSGTVRDLPFVLPWPVIPAGTVLTLKVNGENVPGTDITVKLYDATDDSEINPTGTAIGGSVTFADYSLAANQGKLYVVFTLTGDGDQTPLLFGYELEVSGTRTTRTPTTTTGGMLRSVSVTGPDYDPSQATAKATVSDLTAQLNTLLLTKGAVQARIRTADSSGNVTVLHEGLVIDGRAKWRGGARTYPVSTWRDYEISLSSMWARVQRQINLAVETFSEDANASPDPNTGIRPPWKITDIIVYLLRKLAFPDTQIDIPDIDLRLWPAQNTTEDLIVYPGMSFAEFLQRLAKDYLASVLLWDPNAGTANGMWRLVQNPVSFGSPLASFVAGPSSAWKLPSSIYSYSAGQTFIIDRTYDSWVVPPEANFVVVTSTGELLPSDGGATLNVARIYNPLSFNWDPSSPTADVTHPDYLGEIVPLVDFDPTLNTPEAVAFVARRLYDRVAHAEKWFSFDAPALYIRDLSDTNLYGRYRPLRINDEIQVLGATAIVRSASYSWTRDAAQKMTIEGRYII